MRLLAAAVLVAGVASAVPAQPGGQWGYLADGAFMFLLRNEAVQKDVKMTPEQVEKATAAAKSFQPKLDEMTTAAFGKFRPDTPAEEWARAKVRLTAEVNKEFQKEVEKILNPEQVKRVWQIQVQSLGVGAFYNPEVLTELKLTDDQKKAVAEVMAGFGRQAKAVWQEAFAGGALNQEKTTALANKMREIHKKELENVVGTLTDDQKKVWKEMVGAPFDVSKLAPAFPKKN